MSYPNCYRKKRNRKSLIDYFPKLNYFECFNCKKRFLWLTMLNKNYFLQKESLIK